MYAHKRENVNFNHKYVNWKTNIERKILMEFWFRTLVEIVCNRHKLVPLDMYIIISYIEVDVNGQVL